MFIVELERDRDRDKEGSEEVDVSYRLSYEHEKTDRV